MGKYKLKFLSRPLIGNLSVFSLLIMAVCGCLTTYVFAASYETTFNRNLPYVDAVEAVNLEPINRPLKAQISVKQTDFGNYGKLQYVQIPSLNAKIVLAPYIRIDSGYLARANTGHFILLSPPKSGNIGNLAIYYRKSWRTVNNQLQLKTGDNVFVDTDRDWRYFFRIDDIKTLTSQQQFVSRDSTASQLLLVAYDSQTQQYDIAQASLINVQNVRQ